MALLALCSATGAPGVTTAALGLALHWPRGVLLVDADPTPAQAIEAGYLGQAPHGQGLLDVAHCCRQKGNVTQALWERSVRLDPTRDGASTAASEKRFLSGFSHPGAAELVGPHWAQIAGSLADLEHSAVDVIIDLGRWGAGPSRALLEQLDALVVVTRSSLRGLASLRLSLPTICDTLEQDSALSLGLGIVGPGRPYSATDVGQHFGIPVTLTLPWDERSAAVLSDGAAPPKRHESSELVSALRSDAARLAQQLGRRARITERELVEAAWR